jgi:sugar-specific transcriptional regulator TrmB
MFGFGLISANRRALWAMGDALGLIGIDPRIARVYYRLGERGPQDAATIAQDMSANRSEIYRALAHLTQRGLVAVEASNPIRYRVVDPTDAFTIAAAGEDARVATIERARDAFVGALARAPKTDALEVAGWSFRPITGRHAIHLAARRMIQDARASILISHRHSESAAEAKALGHLLDAAQGRAEGVSLRVVARAALGLPTSRTLTLEPAATFLVVDGRECLFLTPDERKAVVSRQAMWTNAGAVVALAEMLHGDLWASGPP